MIYTETSQEEDCFAYIFLVCDIKIAVFELTQKDCSAFKFEIAKHLLKCIKRTSIITKFFESSRLGELWFIYYWSNFCSQIL
ncbi:hypothetical protein BpHYR1_020815 [Brachionus plicatilis]|uniref:Uncharacterized protein n=1 Tax=Brachionus plicatilis TaxID=10195 RepID=A0A3M7PSP7_BRAPC|nr:hypothetical protein BpHYR1_020815 [Brachionus plicatilis]